MIWLASILIFIAGNITFYILIKNNQDNKQNDLLVWLRVILLDGLFFIMGILLGLCIILVSLMPYSVEILILYVFCMSILHKKIITIKI